MKLPCELCPHPIYPHQHDYIEVATVLHWVAGNYSGDKKLFSKYYHKNHAPQETREIIMSNKPATSGHHDIKDPKCVLRKNIQPSEANQPRFRRESSRTCPECTKAAR